MLHTSPTGSVELQLQQYTYAHSLRIPSLVSVAIHAHSFFRDSIIFERNA